MDAIETPIPGLLIIEPQVFGDDRGFFYESFNAKKFAAVTGVAADFVQDNHSRSAKGVLRGLHYQIQHSQGKLVRVVQGAVLDVAVDIRKSSPTFGQHFSLELSSENKRMLWIPEGFAHGFLVLTEYAEFLYKTSEYYYSEYERCIRWDDPTLKIDWKVQAPPILSTKDSKGNFLTEAEICD